MTYRIGRMASENTVRLNLPYDAGDVILLDETPVECLNALRAKAADQVIVVEVDGVNVIESVMV